MLCSVPLSLRELTAALPACRRVVQEAMEEERWRLRRAVEGLRLPATLGPRERGPLVDLFTEQTVTGGCSTVSKRYGTQLVTDES